MSVLIETTLGDFVFDLYTKERPRSCLNFLKLCKIKYYNYCLFHSVRRNFIAQNGDPTGSGRGGESVFTHVYGDQAKYFELELKPRIKHRTKGTISFVNNGNDMHGSQFFITLGDGLDFLDGKHTVFGQLAEGFDTLEKLNETICDDTHKPYQDVRITHTIILEDPFDDPKGLPIPDKSPEPTKEQLESGRIGADEDVNDEGKSKEEIDRELEDKELQIGTKILETVGDIDDADLKPPENVLFVCKLNPVTNADDLKIIFSRFGKIVDCEIIKDQKTGDSLCYGFVEFKEVEACEKAYFKMDNVLIDDRRIHVDFCQSVAKLKKWHKSSHYQKALDEKKAKFGYQMKDNTRSQEKYPMMFDDEKQNSKKKKKREVKKKIESDSESDYEHRHSTKTIVRQPTKESRKRRNSFSSRSESEDELPKGGRKRKSSYHDSKEQKREKVKYKGKHDDSDASSDVVVEKKQKNTKEEKFKKPSTRYQESDYSDGEFKRRTKDNFKKISRHSEPESDDRKKSFVKMSKKKSKYSDSVSEEEIRKILKKNKSVKLIARKKKYSISEEELDLKDERRKSKTSVKQSKIKKRKSYDDSDTTEEYTSSKKPATRKKKKYVDSSDESSDGEQRRHSSKSSRSKRNYDDKRRSSSSRISSAKKTRRRHNDSDDSSGSSG